MAQHAPPQTDPALHRVAPPIARLPVRGEMVRRLDAEICVATIAVGGRIVAACTVLGPFACCYCMGIQPVTIVRQDIDILSMVTDTAALRLEVTEGAAGALASHIELVEVAVVSCVTARPFR